MARLGDLVEQIRGVSYKPEDLHDILNEKSVMLLRANNIRDGELNFDDVVYVDKSKVKATQYLKAGDIFVCASSGSKDLVGKAAYISADVPAVFGAFCKVVRPKVQNKQYIGHFFDSPIYRKKISDLSSGANINNIRNEHIDELLISIPSAKEQERITIILNEVNTLISLRKQQLAKLDELVKARFVELFGDPVANPFGWRKLTVQQAIDEKIIDKPLDGNHGGKHPKTSDYVPSGIPFIMANNLVEGKVDLENCAFISRKQADSLDKGFAKDGDVLITHKGTIGRTAILHCSYPYIMLTPQVTYYRPKTGIIPEYLKAYFDTDYFQGIIGNIASVGSTRAYIGITAQQELPLIVPPMELQKQFAAFVEQTDKSKLAIQQSLDKLEILKKSLMQKYFG